VRAAELRDVAQQLVSIESRVIGDVLQARIEPTKASVVRHAKLPHHHLPELSHAGLERAYIHLCVVVGGGGGGGCVSYCEIE